MDFQQVLKLPLVEDPSPARRVVHKHNYTPSKKVLDNDDNEELFEEDDDFDEDEQEEKSKERQRNRVRKGRRNLNVNRNQFYGKNESHHFLVANREFFQNLFDQAGVLNGTHLRPDFNNLHFVRGERKNKGKTEDVIILHNGKVRLAEIIHITSPNASTPLYFASERRMEDHEQRPSISTLTFINYGTVVSSASQVLSIGDSSKRNMTNQVGMHGEGLKTAILRMLHCGVGVEIYCCAPNDEGVNVVYFWRFFISRRVDEMGNLGVVTTFRTPSTWTTNARDHVRFQVKLTFNRTNYHAYEGTVIKAKPNMLNFDIARYLVDKKYVRARQNDDDFGSLVLESPGRVWSWHFYVFDRPHDVKFGYDLFVKIGRDRNYVADGDLRRGVAYIWNRIFADASAVDLHFRFFALLCPHEEHQWIEWQILPMLNTQSCEVIARMFLKQFPPPMYPVRRSIKKDSKRALPGMTFIAVSNELHGVLCEKHGVYQSDINKLVAAESALLEKAPLMDNVPPAIASLFVDVVFKASVQCNITYVVRNGKVLVNYPAVKRNKTDDQVIHTLVTSILPEALGTAFNVVPLLKTTKLVIPTTKSPTLPPAPKGPGEEPPRKRHAGGGSEAVTEIIEEVENEDAPPFPAPTDQIWVRPTWALIKKN